MKRKTTSVQWPLFKETQSALPNCVLHSQSHAAKERHAKHDFTQNWKTVPDWSVIHERKWFFVLADVSGGGSHDEAQKTSAWESINTREGEETPAVDEVLKALRKAIKTCRLEEF